MPVQTCFSAISPGYYATCCSTDYVACEPIEFNLCADNLPYTGTASPNLPGHPSQAEAIEAFLAANWHHIVSFCPAIMLQFTCAMAFPQCQDNKMIQ